MCMRLMALTSLLFGLLTPSALADNDFAQAQNNSFSLQFASGSNDVNVTTPGGNTGPAITCTAQPSTWAAALAGSSWVSSYVQDCTVNEDLGTFVYSVSFNVPSGATNLS